MKRRIGLFLPLMLLVSIPGYLSAQNTHEDMLNCPHASWPWTGDGPFVNIPAGLAASPAGMVGAGLALAFVPADIVDAAIHGMPQETTIPRFAHIGVCGGVYLGEGLGFIAGSPFWLLQQALWEQPKRLFSKK